VRVTLLGTGTSHGIPMIACSCAVCTSDDPRDKRTRVSCYVQYDDLSVLVDTGPELRLQCIACDIQRVDAVLMTHHHADHVAGLDDLRRFNWVQGTRLPVYGMPETLQRLREMFRYAFVDDPEYPSSKPDIDLIALDGDVVLNGHRIVPVRLLHGETPVMGYRFDKFAYCTDVSFIPEESMDRLRDLDVLVLDACRRRPHPTHFNVEQAVECARRVGARQTYFTHIAHELKHAETNAELPDSMNLAYDGQVIEL
jgi:phosphoribosyl 1,2-cyclic phosphate phosphodiesterase